MGTGEQGTDGGAPPFRTVDHRDVAGYRRDIAQLDADEAWNEGKWPFGAGIGIPRGGSMPQGEGPQGADREIDGVNQTMAALLTAFEGAGIITAEPDTMPATSWRDGEGVVSFRGTAGAAFRALAIGVSDARYGVKALRQTWTIVNGVPEGPVWEVVLQPQADQPA